MHQAFILLFAIFLMPKLSVTALTDERYQNLDPALETIENSEIENDLYNNDRKTVNNEKHLRFGKRFWNYVVNDVDNENARRQRTGRRQAPDQFIRFGRSRERFMPRFNIHQERRTRARANPTNYLRFGRSFNVEELDKNNREKHQLLWPESTAEYSTAAESLIPDAMPRRHDNHLRFGRNSNYLRFGRNSNNNDQLMPLSLSHVTRSLFSLPNETVLRQIIKSGNESLLNYFRNVMQQDSEETIEAL